MNQRASLETLDDLPIGMVLVTESGIEWQNALIRDGIARDERRPEEVRAALLALAHAHAKQRNDVPTAFLLGEATCYPCVHSSPGSTLVLLMPEDRSAMMFPELARLRELCFDLEEIFRHSFDGIFVADGHGVTLMVNEGCERNYDMKAADMIGRHVSEFEKKGLIRPVVAQQVARTGQRISTTQRTHTGKTIMVTGIPLFDAAGNVRKVIINSRDTTELLQLQGALAQAKADLQRVDAEIEALRLQNLKVDGMVLRSDPMQRIASLAARVAKVDATVLITGQSGVGKDVITRLIHRESPRANGPLIKINCGALPHDLLESELFGYEPGAFTGAQRQGKAGLIELAHTGTLFLDEVGDLPVDLQVKLLQVLQDRVIVRLGGTRQVSIDVRIIAATNRDLKAMVAERTFRDDLFYRLNVVPIAVPPLTARKDDIAPLILQFVDEFNTRYGLQRRFSEPAMALMLAYSWPGNVRELRNVVERVIVTSEAEVIGAEFLDGVLPLDVLDEEPNTFRHRVERFERRLLEDALRKHGSTREVARALGLSQSSVVRKLRPGKPSAQ
jgi:PAS domain S-box-containing protein